MPLQQVEQLFQTREYFLFFLFFDLFFSGSLMEINSTLMYFRSRLMLCFDDEKHKDNNTFKDNCQSEHFIYKCYCLLLKFLCSVFTNLHAQHFIWCHIPHPNTIKMFSNYHGKAWYSSIFVPHYIFLNFFFVIIYEMWT